jgi:hypothetical protein
MKRLTSQAFLSILPASMNSGSSVEMGTKRATFPGISLPLEDPEVLPVKSLPSIKLLGTWQQDSSKRNAPGFPGHFLFPATSMPGATGSLPTH